MSILYIPEWLLAFLAYAVAYGVWYKSVTSLVMNAVYGMGARGGCWFVLEALALDVILFNLSLVLASVTGVSVWSSPLLLFPFLGSLLSELPLLYLFFKCFVR